MRMPESDQDHDVYNHAAVLKLLDVYSTSLGFTPQHSQYTVLASFFLTCSRTSTDIKIISLGTGTKCLPANQLSPKGEIVNDSHAEVLARRSALLWFLEEIQRICSVDIYCSPWLDVCSDGRYALRDGVKLNLYISAVPCGDASMRILASVQDKEMASLKDNTIFPSLDPSAASRGRDDYSRLGVLRTKPGRADSPPTLCMSCSDKIAKWTVLGIQGALSFHFLHALYISNIVIGEVPVDMQAMVREDCERAFRKRLDGIQDLPEDFRVHYPTIYFTAFPFIHSRSVLASNGSCNESLCWTADSQPFEILINGLKRGVSPKHRYRDKARPRVSRIALLHSFNLTLIAQKKTSLSDTETYLRLKLSSSSYQIAKEKLIGKGGLFVGWLVSGKQWQEFNLNGELP